jgi:hypothetical protein
MSDTEIEDNADLNTDLDLDALIAELTASFPSINDDSGDEYPLPEKKPVKYTNVDVIVLPRGYKSESKPKSEYPKPEPKTEDSRARFTDSAPAFKLDLDSAQETDGVLSVPATVAKSSHIYDYDGLKVVKPFEELQAAAAFADGIPVTREHPRAGIVTDRSEVLGFFRNPIAEDNVLKGVLEITGKDLIADIKAGTRTDVSPGFFCELDTTTESGAGSLDGENEGEGEHFDATQRNIFLNHIAVCEHGRCSYEDGCGIGLDASKNKTPVPQDIVDQLKACIERAKAMKDKSLLNMLQEVLKAVKVAKDSIASDDDNHNNDPKKLKTIKDALESFRSQKQQLIAERDALKAKLDELITIEKDSLVAELTALQDAKTPDDLQKLSLDELQKELDMVKQMKADKLSIGTQKSAGRGAIDEAYAKIG